MMTGAEQQEAQPQVAHHHGDDGPMMIGPPIQVSQSVTRAANNGIRMFFRKVNKRA